jgi:hypothetical protein
MSLEDNIPSLASLEYIAYINQDGELPEEFSRQIGVYAIFDEDKILNFVGYSRDVYLSLKQHLVRQPEKCYWVKVQTIERPHRTTLENIENSWIAENSSLSLADHQEKWLNPIDVKPLMTDVEQNNYQNLLHDELTQSKILKNVARRVESEILTLLTARGLKTQIRFNPKLKDKGLLDL